MIPTKELQRPNIKTELPGPRSREIIEADARYVTPSYPRPDYKLVVERASGVWVEDPDGNIFLDQQGGVVGAQGHPDDRRERLAVAEHRQRRRPEQKEDERDAEQAFAGHPAHPAIRTVVVAPHTARDRRKSTMFTETIASRTARPTATPTPAGPPLAV